MGARAGHPAEERVAVLVRDAVERVRRELGAQAPALSRRSWAWMRRLANGAHPARYYTSRADYPVLLLPYWLTARLATKPDARFQRDLIYSTINGYYFLRLCDNLMDGESTLETELLPAAAFFHSEFQAQYARYFPPKHAFWRIFRRDWYRTAAATFGERGLKRVTLPAFHEISARKTLAARIPIAAACLRHARPELWPAWSDFMERLGRVIQMADDLSDWMVDAQRSSGASYFLSEAERRRRKGESAAAWIMNGGFRWGLDTCLEWSADLGRRASELECPEVAELLERRHDNLAAWGARTADGLAELRPLAAGWNGGGSPERRRSRFRKECRSNHVRP